VQIEPDELADLEVGVASTMSDLEQALRLLDRAYVTRGITQRAHTLRIPPHYEAEHGISFVAVKNKRVVGTVSLVADGREGLPLESVYGDCISELRRSGRLMAEVGALAVADGCRRHGVSMLLYKLMFRTALDVCGVQDLVIAVHPHAAELYCSMMGFKRVGPVRGYTGMTDRALAVLLRLDLAGARDDLARAFAGWPRDQRNTFHMYFEREHPQISIPSIDDVARGAGLRAWAVARLRDAPAPRATTATEIGTSPAFARLSV
jgi:hypothetical protein